MLYFLIKFIIALLYFQQIPLLNDSQLPNQRKIGFALMTYSEESVDGIIELMDKIYSDKHCYIMHFDTKTPLESIKKFKSLFPSVKMTKNQIDVQWGSFSLVRAQLELAMVDCDYSHLIYLDGASFPMQPLENIEKEISKIPVDHSIVFSNDPGYGSIIPTCKEGSPTMQACSRSSARCTDAECTKYTLTPDGGPIYKGPQWSILSKSFIDYFKMEKQWLHNWISFFDSSYMIADEAFFQTLFMNSPYKDTRYLFKQDWMRTVWLDCKTEHTQLSEMGWSPCLLGLNDFDPHLKNSTSLFVRKLRVGAALKKKLFEKYDFPELQERIAF